MKCYKQSLKTKKYVKNVYSLFHKIIALDVADIHHRIVAVDTGKKMFRSAHTH